jgi:2-C-methyl-D-erythritol 4-phosphate cytidylyltransferase/2-C-methyl-D-erythritol 2,4-cyclodiphosphate synthase
LSERDIHVVLTAAGRSTRFGPSKKELARLGPGSVLDSALSPFLQLEDLGFIVITAPAESLAKMRVSLSRESLELLGPRLAIVAGGPSRRDSVRLGLESLAGLAGGGMKEEDLVLVHDGARPWLDLALIERVVEAADRHGAALPLVPLTDTPKLKGGSGLVEGHPARSSLGGAQTPQGFRFQALLECHRRAAAEGRECTDDAELWAAYGGQVAWVEGDVENRKITYASDMPAGQRDGQAQALRIGQGWDLHRLARGRKLFLGGVEIEAEAGELAHSDGDVLLHAVIDALLGAAALGDIGSHFPPSDPRWKDADSRDLALQVMAMVREAGWAPVNLDTTVILEKPRLSPHREAIRASLSALLGLPLEAVSFKAKTSEGVNATGEGLSIEAQAAVLLEQVVRNRSFTR